MTAVDLAMRRGVGKRRSSSQRTDETLGNATSHN